MVVALYIFVDDDFDTPIYGEPDREELDPDLHRVLCETVNEAFEGDRPASGHHTEVDELRVGWRFMSRLGLSFICAVPDDVKPGELDAYLKALQKHYLDEVDDPREPEREGVEDVIVDVVAPWED